MKFSKIYSIIKIRVVKSQIFVKCFFKFLITVGVPLFTLFVLIWQGWYIKKSADDAHIALTDIQRAFLVVDEIRQRASTDGAGRTGLLLDPVIQNSGNTPALDVKYVSITPNNAWKFNLSTNVSRAQIISLAATIGAPADPDEFISSSSNENVSLISHHGILGPKGSIYPEAELISGDDTLEAQSGPGTIGRFFYGSIRYKDVFGKEHVTKYCFRIDQTLINNGINQVGYLARCQYWNCVDETCTEDKIKYDAEAALVFKKSFSK